MNKLRMSQSGDTIIEVILAMALLALVLFTSWSVTNRASQISLAARQRVVMVNQLKEQAELIKAYNQINHEDLVKGTLLGSVTPKENPCDDIDLTKDESAGSGSAWITENAGQIIPIGGTKKIDGDLTQRVWYQRKVGSGAGDYYDFYVRACWRVTGGTQKLDNSQFIVRINK